jgi:hypothetical protein
MSISLIYQHHSEALKLLILQLTQIGFIEMPSSGDCSLTGMGYDSTYESCWCHYIATIISTTPTDFGMDLGMLVFKSKAIKSKPDLARG